MNSSVDVSENPFKDNKPVEVTSVSMLQKRLRLDRQSIFSLLPLLFCSLGYMYCILLSTTPITNVDWKSPSHILKLARLVYHWLFPEHHHKYFFTIWLVGTRALNRCSVWYKPISARPIKMNSVITPLVRNRFFDSRRKSRRNMASLKSKS